MVIASTLIRTLVRIARKAKVMTLALLEMHEPPSVPDIASSSMAMLLEDSMTTLGKRGPVILRSMLTIAVEVV